MRFKLTLKIDRKYGDNLPFNYQYEQSAVIYRILAQADKQYASWLHANGYSQSGTKRFKLFTYSPFIFDRVHAVPQCGCLNIIGNMATWYISFIPEKSTSEFVHGVFSRQRFTIGNRIFKVAFDIVNIEASVTPSFCEDVVFKALSPVCVKMHEANRVKYLAPSDPLFVQGIINGLMAKYEIIHGHPLTISDEEMSIEIVDDKIKSKLVTIKSETASETKVRGFLFLFRLRLPLELMRIAYEGGIGEQCSQGFGFININ